MHSEAVLAVGLAFFSGLSFAHWPSTPLDPPQHHDNSPSSYQPTPHKNWHTLNSPLIAHTGPSTFTITTPPATDIWRPNVTADNFTAPYYYTVCKASSFKFISVTVSADWKTRYDQGGIAVFFPNQHKHSNHGDWKKGKKEPMKWVKTGIEFENGAPQFGTVGTYAFSDWSLSPIRPANSTSGKFIVDRSTTEMWVYVDVPGEEGRYPLREVTWAFLEERGEEEAEVWVGVYAAKPTYEDGDLEEGLTVSFQDLEVEC